jgi:hypothetical protein
MLLLLLAQPSTTPTQTSAHNVANANTATSLGTTSETS